MLRHLNSLPYQESGGQVGVLEWAISVHLQFNVAATIVFYSMKPFPSPPVQRDGKSIASGCLDVFPDSVKKHHNASTHRRKKRFDFGRAG